MLERAEVSVERLSAAHPRAAFASGNATLDGWLHRQARQEQQRRSCTVYVMLHRPTGMIAGYYTLSSAAISTDTLDEALRRRLPRYDATAAILIGRLARDLRFRGQGAGEMLLADALQRCLSLSEQLGAVVVIVDAIDDHAARFYEQFGFIPTDAGARRLYLPLATVARIPLP